MKKINLLFLGLILFLGFLVRLYHFDAPVADWHSWRQVDTSSVSRNFVNKGFDIFHPRFDDLSNVPSGIYDNPNGYRFVEFPIFNILQAGFFKIFDHLTIEEWGRLVSIFSSLISAVFIYLICKKHAGEKAGIFAAFFYLLLPFNIFYSRTILPDQTAALFTLAGIYYFDIWINNNMGRSKILLFILTGVFLAASLLTKPFSAFFLLPILFLSFEKFGKAFYKRKDLWLMFILAILPELAWRAWSLKFPEGIPQSGWLFNGGNIRFKGAYFDWIFAKRLGDLILGFWGIPILVMGLITKRKNLFLFSFILSSLIYLIVVARGNVQHSYYQIPIIPSIAIFLGVGVQTFLKLPKEYFSRRIAYPTLAMCILLMLSFSWKNVRDYYNIDNPAVIEAGKAVDRLTPKDAKVIALYGGDTTLLYFTKRQGWASLEKDIPGLIKIGASFLVIPNPRKEDLGIGKTYKVLESNSQYVIFDLHKKP